MYAQSPPGTAGEQRLPLWHRVCSDNGRTLCGLGSAGGRTGAAWRLRQDEPPEDEPHCRRCYPARQEDRGRYRTSWLDEFLAGLVPAREGG
jgi:hypothetical protein